MNSAVIVAAGQGARFGTGEKQLIEIGGRPVLWYSVAALSAASCIDNIVLVTRKDLVERCVDEVAAAAGRTPFLVVEGGDERQESVRCGLAACPPEAEVVWIHDGARPLLTAARVEESERALNGLDGLIFASPIVDTLKEVVAGIVTTTVPRERFFRAETPQVFPAHIIRAAYEQAVEERFTGTDDAAVVERQGGRVGIYVSGDLNLKVTTAHDLAIVEQELERRGMC